VAENEFIESEAGADEQDFQQSKQSHARIVTAKLPNAPR
jgi:hypothetical protein